MAEDCGFSVLLVPYNTLAACQPGTMPPWHTATQLMFLFVSYQSVQWCPDDPQYGLQDRVVCSKAAETEVGNNTSRSQNLNN